MILLILKLFLRFKEDIHKPNKPIDLITSSKINENIAGFSRSQFLSPDCSHFLVPLIHAMADLKRAKERLIHARRIPYSDSHLIANIDDDNDNNDGNDKNDDDDGDNKNDEGNNNNNDDDDNKYR